MRSVARSRFYTAIGVAGLSIAFAAILVITLFVRNELGYDRHIRGHERIYRIAFVPSTRESQLNSFIDPVGRLGPILAGVCSHWTD
ncbi:MAG: hypothetical protein ABI645_01205 [Pseudomonadota bacterium]